MKPKIYATGNENLSGDFNISYYIIEKDEKFLDWLTEVLVKIFNISDGERRAKFIIRDQEDENGNIIRQEVYAKEINKMIDLHEHYQNNRVNNEDYYANDRIDIFYGKNRVYVTLRKSKETRKKFAEFVKKSKQWIDIKEIPEIPSYASQKP